MTSFDQHVHLIVSCGAEDLRNSLERTGKNANYTPKITVVDLWAEESILKHLHQATCFSLMADECTDITVVELSIFCHWVEDEVPVKH